MTEPTTTPRALLERAAALLDERGWGQGHYRGADGCLCALGAIRSAAAEAAGAGMRADHDLGEEETYGLLYDSPGLRAAWREAEEAADRELPVRDLISWNDEEGRTKAEVQELLRRAAGGSR